MNHLTFSARSISNLYLLYVFVSSVILSFQYQSDYIAGFAALLLYCFSFTTNSFLVIKITLLVLSIPYVVLGLRIYASKKNFSLTYTLPIAAFVSWFIGFVVAIFNSIPLQDSLSNFSYLLIAPIAYCFYLFSPQFILISSFCASFLILFLYINAFSYHVFFFSVIFYLNSIFIAWIPLFASISGVNLAVAFQSCFPYLFLFFKSAFFRKLFTLIVFIVCLPVVFTYISATTSVIFLLFLSLFLRKKLFPIKTSYFVILIGMLLSLLVFTLDLFPLISSLIRSELDSDIRLLKLSSVINDLTLFGNGLGASFVSLDGRGKDYGFELIYLNLVHKLGIFAYPILSIYIVVAVQSIKTFFLRFHSFSFARVLSSSSIVFLIAGLFNPTLGSFYASLFIFISYPRLSGSSFSRR